MGIVTEEIFDNIWGNGLIIFDTCGLLRMYEYKEPGAIELKDILDYKKDEIWLPHQVKKEFDRKHVAVMSRELSKYTDAITKIKNNPTRYENEIKGILKECEGKRYSDDFISDLEEILKKIQNGDTVGFSKLEETAKVSEEDILKFHSRKVVEGILGDIFKNIGSQLPNEAKLLVDFNNLVQAQKNAKNKSNWTKVKQSYDYLVWQQVLCKAKEVGKPILFVTADVQPNFWIFDNKLGKRIPHPALVSEYKNFVGNEESFNMISLHNFFELCSNYLNKDIEHIIKYLEVDELVREKFDTWFPDELMDVVKDYLESDPSVKSEIIENIDSCYDYADINGFEYPEIEDIEYTIKDDFIIYEGQLTIYVDVDANYHCAGEDGTIGSTYLQLRINFSFYQNIEWESKESGRVAIEKELYNVEVSDPEVIWIKESEYSSASEDENSFDEPDECEYDEEEYCDVPDDDFDPTDEDEF